MKCADPVLCYTDGKGNRKFRHFSLSSHIHKLVHQQVFNCGKCLFCRKRRATELALKCVLHASLYKQNCFITLTYDEKKEGYHNVFEYPDVQKFKKKLRQHVSSAEYCVITTGNVRRRRFPKWLRKKIEVFNVHEYGRNGKKHWHLIVFGWEPAEKELHTISGSGSPLYKSRELGELWSHGFSSVGDVSEGSAMYQAQYCEKDFKYGNVMNERKSHSRHSGIGKPYFLMHYDQILRLGFVPVNGRRLPVPRSFEKIAHRHYCHFYEESAFEDLPWRKRLYRRFKEGEAKKDLADLYVFYKSRKDEKIEELEVEWSEVIEKHLTEKWTPDFIGSGSNALYDLLNKQKKEKF